MGINDKMMKDMAESFTPGCSALFVLVRKASPDKLLAGLKEFQGKGKVLQPSLKHDNEEALRKVLEQKKSEVISKYEDWKTDREIEKLEKHADEMEDQAVDAVVVAAFGLLEAEVAIVEALKSRKIAIEVAG